MMRDIYIKDMQKVVKLDSSILDSPKLNFLQRHAQQKNYKTHSQLFRICRRFQRMLHTIHSWKVLTNELCIHSNDHQDLQHPLVSYETRWFQYNRQTANHRELLVKAILEEDCTKQPQSHYSYNTNKWVNWRLVNVFVCRTGFTRQI